MPSIIMRRIGGNGEEIDTKIESMPLKNIRQGLKFSFDEQVYEEHRMRENNQAFSYVAEALKQMKEESRNGFGYLSLDNQKEMVSERKIQIESILMEHGSFFINDLKKEIERGARIVDKIYKPHMKWARRRPLALSN